MRITYNVAPRWTGGSPAPVSKEIAMQVAREERIAHAHALGGLYGEIAQASAQDGVYALRGIIEERYEFATGWLVLDVLTQEVFYRFAERSDRKPPTVAQRKKARELMFKEQWRRDRNAYPSPLEDRA